MLRAFVRKKDIFIHGNRIIEKNLGMFIILVVGV